MNSFLLSSSIVDHHQIQEMPHKHFKAWINIISKSPASGLANVSGVRPSVVRGLTEAGRLVMQEDRLFLNLDVVRFREDRPSANEWAAIRAFVFDRDDYRCKYCAQRGGRLECDHVIPVSRCGSNDPENLVTACFSCNRSKRDKTPEEWIR